MSSRLWQGLIAVFIPPRHTGGASMTQQIETDAHELEATAARERTLRSVDTLIETAEAALRKVGYHLNGRSK